MVKKWKTYGFSMKNHWLQKQKPDIYVYEDVNVDVYILLYYVYISGGGVFFFSPPPHNYLVPQ